MELQDYIRVLRRRGWIIVLLVVMTAVAAFAFSKLQTPIYESAVDILVQPARADLGLSQSVKMLLRSYVSWMNTDTRAQEVIDLLSLDRVPGELRSNVKIASDESRLVIQMNVEDPNGELANNIAQAWTDLFVQWRNSVNAGQRKEDQVEAIQLDPPRYALARPKWKINVLAGAILGGLIGGVVVFTLEWIESGVVRRPEDVDRYLDLALLGAIPAARIDASRPYLLGTDYRPAGPTPPAAIRAETRPALAAAKPEPPPPGDQPSPATEPAPARPAEAEGEAPADEGPAPPAPAGEEDEIGPIKPTILLSKGD
jgi:capsular polysaccharide biosynthesis protein